MPSEQRKQGFFKASYDGVHALNRQSGASHHRTPILNWTGVTIEMHLLSQQL